MIVDLIKKISIAVLILIPIKQIFGYAHTNLMLENNCSADAIFTITNSKGGIVLKKALRPHQYYTTKALLNDNFLLSTTSNYDIKFKSKNSSGSVKYELSNAFFYFGEKGANRAMFKDAIGNIEVNHKLHNNNYKYYWTNYSVNVETLLKGNLIIPSFTVSACHKEINLFDSLLFGVKKILI